MRSSFGPLFAATLLCLAACDQKPKPPPSEPEVPFVPNSNLTPQEKAGLPGLPDALSPNSYPFFLAVWPEPSGTKRVYLQRSGLQTYGTPYYVFLFDDKGRFLEQNQIGASPDNIPRYLIGISPVRVAFAPNASKPTSEIRGYVVTSEKWRQLMKDFDALKKTGNLPQK